MLSQVQLKAYNKFIDVFTGEGWYNHTRFTVHNKVLKFVSGKTLTKHEFLQVKQGVTSNANSSKK